MWGVVRSYIFWIFNWGDSIKKVELVKNEHTKINETVLSESKTFHPVPKSVAYCSSNPIRRRGKRPK